MTTAATPTTTGTTTGATTWSVDPAHSLVEFAVKHLMISTVKGRFGDVKGTITLNESQPTQSKVEIEIATGSIDTRSEQRDGHLRSGDFLDVAQFPTVSFRSKRIEGARAAEQEEATALLRTLGLAAAEPTDDAGG